MSRPTLRVAIFQCAILLMAACIAWLVWGEKTALSAAYGVVVGIVMTLVMIIRERESESHSEWTAQRQLGQFFRLEAERFIIAIVLLALGFMSGKMEPVGLIAGFVLGQLGWIAALIKAKTS